VESELKGVKLFVNRGGKGFGDGMIGHIKLLSNKQIQSDRLRELAIEYITRNYGTLMGPLLNKTSLSARPPLASFYECSP